MYQVLLADDEQSIMDSMLNHIPWAQYNMEVAYTATSGKQAYDILVNTPPDIAILDIRMPGYSGLELCRMVSKQALKTQVIIISGYAEFSYAQKAIQYGVLGYCLKPVEYDEVTGLLLKAIRNLQQSTPSLISSDDFLAAVDGNDTDKISRYLEENGILQDSYYFVSSVSDAPLQLPGTLSFRVGINHYGYLSCSPYDRNLLEEASRSPGVLGIGVYPLAVTARDFQMAFYKYTSMAYHFFMNPECRICDTYHDFHSVPLMLQIQKAVSFAEKERLCELLTQLKEGDSYKQLSIHSAQLLYNMIISNPQLVVNPQDYMLYNYRQLVHEYASFTELLDSLLQLINAAPETHEESEGLSNVYFLRIMKYVNTYYHENITLRDVAKMVNLNPNYISQLFKKSAGTTFSHYLTNLRITNAKKLLTTTDISINEISLKTGFNDYFYFLKTFKKYTGHTPSEYRNLSYERD
nr:helix-turn-helix domain-containing protein [uncultured Acetatifactor sp.]